MIEKYDSVNPPPEAACRERDGAPRRSHVMEAATRPRRPSEEISEKSALFKKTRESHDAY